ncbi:uncharacterized protein LOC128606453 isoform X2 [Ictalurus furcatus]|uniref:uncharacterized protein LOC128606453 isoform X2 n=1 Tax=Ictalurus furcatus TaxID=66913 RepID=UPI0023510433|nr:uncharacterized protein LOC128606453 isoform X2 [Ictalurus furcatus]
MRRGGLANEQVILRDQFVEGVRDTALRWELRKIIREKPKFILLELHNEAILWSMEETRPARTVISRQDKRISEHEQNISEQNNSLTKSVKELTLQRSLSVPQACTPLSKAPPRFTEEGEPICFRCNRVGHIARRCTMRRGGQPKSAAKTTEEQEKQGSSVALNQETQGVISGLPTEGTS